MRSSRKIGLSAVDRSSIHPLSNLQEDEMKRNAMFVGVVGTLALALGLVVGRPAQAQNNCTSTTFDLTGTELISPCNGGLIVLTSGTLTITGCLQNDRHASFRYDYHA